MEGSSVGSGSSVGEGSSVGVREETVKVRSRSAVSPVLSQIATTRTVCCPSVTSVPQEEVCPGAAESIVKTSSWVKTPS